MDANPLHVAAIQNLQSFHARRRQEGEHVDVFVTEETRGAGIVHLARHRRVVIQSQTEIRAGELCVVQMRIAAEVREHCLHRGKNEPLVRRDDLLKEFFVLRQRPEFVEPPLRRLWPAESRLHVECAPAEHPAFDQIGMLLAGFVDRKVALID